MYADEDLRRVIFFQSGSGGYRFKGSYTGILGVFCGLSVNELILTRAECRARSGDGEGARADLNRLLE